MKFSNPDPLGKKESPMQLIPQNYRKQVTGEILQEELSMHYRAGGSLLLRFEYFAFVLH